MRWLVVVIACMFLFPSVCYSAETWEERFINTDLVDLNESDAYIYINPAGGYAELPAKSPVAGLELKEGSYDKVVMTSSGIEYFMFDGTGMIKNPVLSAPIHGSSVAVRQDSYSVWAATDKEIFRLDFDGAGMVNNPFLGISGKRNILSVSSQPQEDALAILMRDYTSGGLIEYHAFDGGTMASLITFEAPRTLGSPIDIAVVPGTMDIIYATDEAVIYYSFTGDSFVQNPFMSLLGVSNIRALSVGSDGSFAILRADRKERYMFTGTEMSHVAALSLDLPGAITIALRPGEYDFAVLKDDGSIDYYQFDGTGYILNPALSTQVNLPAEAYFTPRKYISRVINFAEASAMFLLDTDEDKPAGTQIEYHISSGPDQWEITPGAPLTIAAPIQTLTLIATLSTTGPNTPRITRMRLSALNMGLESIKMDMFPVHRDYEALARPFPIYPAFPPGYIPPVPTQVGSVVIFELKSTGTVETIEMELELWRSAIVPAESITLPLSMVMDDVWVGILNVPGDLPVGARYSLKRVRLTGDGRTMVIPPDGAMHDPLLVIVDETDLNLLNFIDVFLSG